LKKPELNDIMLRNLYEFYLVNDRIKTVIPIITSNSVISIRVLDWFVTNYSKKHNIIYELKANNNEKYFNVYLQYKCQLKAYKKKLFDPFCRKQRIAFYYDDNKCVVSTIGQLNFFKWAIKYEILPYVTNNLDSITSDMINSNKILINKFNKINDIIKFNKISKVSKSNDITESTTVSSQDLTNSEKKERKKRHELSNNANKTVNIHNYSFVLSFD
jgi:hypothetical protein